MTADSSVNFHSNRSRNIPNPFSRCWAMFGLLLFATTWRLWTPQTVYPQIPLFESLVGTPRWVDWLSFGGVVGSLATTLILGWKIESGRRSNRAVVQIAAMAVFAVSLLMLILIDQHRLQPWAWQFLLFATVMGIAPRRSSVSWLRLIVISIYLYSAASKFDYQFLHTVGQQFLSTITGFFGVSTDSINPSLRPWIVATFPVGEFLVGVGLLIPKFRRAAVIAAVCLHASLLVILGSFGMQHQPAVLVWNAYFACQAVFLFWQPDDDPPGNERQTSKSILPRIKGTREMIVTVIAIAAIIFPATESIDLCDHWPAWDLYSPRSSRAHVFVNRLAIEGLPKEIREFVTTEEPKEGDAEDLWVRLRIDRWSLETLGVPVYPEDRFQLAVANAIDQRFTLDRRLRVELLGDSNRFSGERDARLLSGSQPIRQAAERFRLNTSPR